MSDQTAPNRLKVVSAIVFATAIIVIVVVAAGGAFSYVWAQGYEGRIAPNVWIGSVAVGGLDPEVARQTVQDAVDAFVLHGVPVTLDGTTRQIPLTTISTNDAGTGSDDVSFDVDAAISQALAAKRSGSSLTDTFDLATALVDQTHVGIPATVNRDQVEAAVRAAFPTVEAPPVNAGFAFTSSASGWHAAVTPDAAGEAISFDAFFNSLQTQVANLDQTTLSIASAHKTAEVDVAEAQSLLSLAEAAVNRAPFTLTYDADRFSHQVWTVSRDDVAQALRIADVNGTPMLTLSEEALAAVLDPIDAAIDRPASDARFTVDNDRVTEFAASEDGIALDRDATLSALNALLPEPSVQTPTETSVAVAVSIVKPNLPTGAVNDLGITEVLGVGTSNYGNSPPNRIKNIRNGVKLLNGLLIQPGETFSLVSALKPFELTNGYLPELVIKGDKIEPEIAGGLCQIGTTTFRAAMNAGLPIVERENHSLVVSYYNDPSNGNPGTDATIYDPSPDFKFTNDTGHAILFQAVMDEPHTSLRFTFWGTSDGRKGSYSPPVVLRWIPASDPETIETADLAPGVQQCQAMHTGADAQFTYTVEHSDGTKDERVFTSHYRALPKICLVGIDPNAPPPSDPSVSPDGSSSDADATPIPVTDATAPTATNEATNSSSAQ